MDKTLDMCQWRWRFHRNSTFLYEHLTEVVLFMCRCVKLFNKKCWSACLSFFILDISCKKIIVWFISWRNTGLRISLVSAWIEVCFRSFGITWRNFSMMMINSILFWKYKSDWPLECDQHMSEIPRIKHERLKSQNHDLFWPNFK